MLNKILNPYKNLSKEIWILAFMTLVNRAGAMVLPFLTLYLTKSLAFSLEQVSWIMLIYGFGSLAGAWTGGKLTDKFGYYKIMYLSLFFTGVGFFVLVHLTTFLQFAIGMFLLIFMADIFRPAIWIAMDDYSNKENKTRSVTLVRLAINLGYAVGPFFAGKLANISYNWLFWLDGSTAVIGAIIIYFFLFQKRKVVPKNEIDKTKKVLKPYRDFQFVIFWFAIFLSGIAFIQFIEVWPVFYNKIIHLNESQIGNLLALNGLLIFLLEMPIVDYFDKRISHIKLIIVGLFLFGLSFFILIFNQSIEIVIVSMVLISVGEIFCFPFSNIYALERSKKGNQGEYMAFFTMTYSAAFIIAPIGLYLLKLYNFNIVWYLSTILIVISIFLIFLLQKNIKNEDFN
jgi:MFS family permease